MELINALYSIGYAVPPSVFQFLMSKYDDGSSRRGELISYSFVECGMIVKVLTKKFKEKATLYWLNWISNIYLCHIYDSGHPIPCTLITVSGVTSVQASSFLQNPFKLGY